VHPEVRPQLRYGREPIQRPGCTQQARKATQADARCSLDECAHGTRVDMVSVAIEHVLQAMNALKLASRE
jgi:hypothetical protein